MKDLIADIVKALVDQPEQVTVTEIETGNTVILELSVAKSDMGKVIGAVKSKVQGRADMREVSEKIKAALK